MVIQTTQEYYVIECNSNTSGAPEHDRWFEWYHYNKKNFTNLERALAALKRLGNTNKGRTSDFRIVKLTREVVRTEEL
jgi:hypothetical protein